MKSNYHLNKFISHSNKILHLENNFRKCLDATERARIVLELNTLRVACKINGLYEKALEDNPVIVNTIISAQPGIFQLTSP